MTTAKIPRLVPTLPALSADLHALCAYGFFHVRWKPIARGRSGRARPMPSRLSWWENIEYARAHAYAARTLGFDGSLRHAAARSMARSLTAPNSSRTC